MTQRVDFGLVAYTLACSNSFFLKERIILDLMSIWLAHHLRGVCTSTAELPEISRNDKKEM